jgi:Xaa-Pro aminopeptidase
MPKDFNSLLITTLDDIAWTLNLRGNDIEFNPLFFSYLLFSKDTENINFSLDLFINKDKISEEHIQKYLSENNVQVHHY